MFLKFERSIGSILSSLIRGLDNTALATASRLLLLSMAVLSSACLDSDFGNEPLFSCDSLGITEGSCVDQAHPLAFTSNVEGLALGAEAEVSVSLHASLSGYRVTSSDPAVLEVERAGDVIVLRSVGTGEATITAYPTDSALPLDSLSIFVDVISEVDFLYPPIGQSPLAELAGIVGSADQIYAVYRDEDGRVLASEGAAEIVVEGALSLGGDSEPRLSALAQALFTPLPRGTWSAITFEAPGPGRILARTIDGREFSLATTGVAEATELLVEADAPLRVGTDTFFFLRGATADDVPVVGLRATWSLDPRDTAEVTAQAEPSSEIAIKPTQAGPLRVNVDVDGVTVTTELVVAP